MPGGRTAGRVAALAIAAVALLGQAGAAGGAGTAPGDPACDWPMYGHDASRDGSSTCPAAPTPASVGSLVPRWFVPTAASVTASPSVSGGVAYVGDWAGTFHAVDVASGTVLWTTVLGAARADGNADHHADDYGQITSSAAIADVGGRHVAFVGAGGSMYAVDLRPGIPDATRVLWRFDVDPAHPTALGEVESSPVVWSRSGADPLVLFGADANQDSGFVGEGLWAVDALTGGLAWHLNPEVAAGRALYGCGNVWSSPLLDVVAAAPPGAPAALAVVGLADCPDNGPVACPADGSDPACPPGTAYDPSRRWSRYSEAILGVDAATGAITWAFQPRPSPVSSDDDFGASPQLVLLPGGRRAVGEGGKDGHYYLLDRDTGALLHDSAAQGSGEVQPGFAIGGYIGTPSVAVTPLGVRIAGGSAIDTPARWTGSSVALQPQPAAVATPMRALDPLTGALSWSAVQAPTYAATTTAAGVVYVGALDGLVRAYDAVSGALLWAGAVDGPVSSGVAVTGDTLVVGAGTSDSDVTFKTCDRLGDPLAGPCRGTPLDQQVNPLARASGIWAFAPPGG